MRRHVGDDVQRHGTIAEQQDDVAGVASRIFGAESARRRVIVETLVRATTVRDPEPSRAGAGGRATRGQVEYADDLRATPNSCTTRWPRGSRTRSASPRRAGRAGSCAARRRPSTGRGRRLAATDRLTSGPVRMPSGHPAGRLGAPRTRAPGGRSSPSACTSSFPRAARLRHRRAPAVRHITSDPADRPASSMPELDREAPLPARLLPRVRPGLPDGRGPRGRRRRRSLHRPPRPCATGGDQLDGYLFISDDREWPVDPVAEGRLPTRGWRRRAARQPVVRPAASDVPRRVLVSPRRDAERPLTPARAGPVVAAFDPRRRSGSACTAGSPTSRPEAASFAKLATLDREGRSQRHERHRLQHRARATRPRDGARPAKRASS